MSSSATCPSRNFSRATRVLRRYQVSNPVRCNKVTSDYSVVTINNDSLQPTSQGYFSVSTPPDSAVNKRKRKPTLIRNGICKLLFFLVQLRLLFVLFSIHGLLASNSHAFFLLNFPAGYGDRDKESATEAPRVREDGGDSHAGVRVEPLRLREAELGASAIHRQHRRGCRDHRCGPSLREIQGRAR